MSSQQVIEYKGYQIEVHVDRVGTFFAMWQVQQSGQAELAKSGAISRDFANAYEAEVAAIEKAKAWIDGARS